MDTLVVDGRRCCFLLGLALTWSCGSTERETFEATTHFVAIVHSGEGTGVVSSTPGEINCGTRCNQEFADGTTVTFTATPGASSTFAGWSDDRCPGATCTITLTRDETLHPMFARSNSLVVSVTGTGVVESTPTGIRCPPSCSAGFAPTQNVTLTALPGPEAYFTGWDGAGCSGVEPCVVSAALPRNVTAGFAFKRYDITLTKAGDGDGLITSTPAGIACGATCTTTVDSGTVVTLTAAAATGSTFTGWSGGACSGTGNCTLTATAAASVIATFTIDRHLLAVFKVGNGNVFSSPDGIACGPVCDASFAFGTDVVLIAAANPGSVFSGWSGGGCSGTGACFVTITQATQVAARFDATLSCSTFGNCTQ